MTDFQLNELLAGANEVHERLSSAFSLSRGGNPDPVFYIRSRVKSVKSISDKIQDRSLRYGFSYEVSDVTDIVGFRIVSLYDDHLLDSITWALNVLKNTYSLSLPLIDSRDLSRTVGELKAFIRSRDPSDIYAQGFLAAKKLLRGVRSTRSTADGSLYSSLHITAKINSYSLGYVSKIPVEIQFRTAIEDIWGEVSHKNEYKARVPDVWSPALDRAFQSNKRNIEILKKSFDGGLPGHISQIYASTKAISDEIAKTCSLTSADCGSFVMDQIFILINP